VTITTHMKMFIWRRRWWGKLVCIGMESRVRLFCLFANLFFMSETPKAGGKFNLLAVPPDAWEGVELHEAKKKKCPFERASSVVAVAALATVAVAISSEVKACMNEDTSIISLGVDQRGRENIKVVHAFGIVSDQQDAVDDAMREIDGHVDTKTVRVESFSYEKLFGKREVVFTVNRTTDDQYVVDGIANTEAERAAAVPVEPKDKGDGTFGFTVIKSDQNFKAVIARTIASFREEHPDTDFNVVNLAGQGDMLSYLIIPKSKVGDVEVR
jgi:hypothetical protein